MFRSILAAVAVWCCLAQAAASQDLVLGEYPAFQTRHGLLGVERASQWEQVLTWNGQPLPVVTDAFVSIAGAWALPDSDLDWVLISSAHNGNMCPGTWFLGRVDALGIALSERFGECAPGGVQDVRVYPDRVEVDLPHPDIAVDLQTVAFDGWALTVTLEAPVLGEGQASLSDPRQWIGLHPVMPLRDPNEQARFLDIMPEETFRLLERQIGGPGAGVFERDGWVLASACMAHQCNTHAGMWGIRLSDGAAAAAVLTLGGPTVSAGAFTDPVFEAFYFAERQRMQ